MRRAPDNFLEDSRKRFTALAVDVTDHLVQVQRSL